MRARVCEHTHTQYMHTYIHTYIHTYTRTQNRSWSDLVYIQRGSRAHMNAITAHGAGRQRAIRIRANLHRWRETILTGKFSRTFETLVVLGRLKKDKYSGQICTYRYLTDWKITAKSLVRARRSYKAILTRKSRENAHVFVRKWRQNVVWRCVTAKRSRRICAWVRLHLHYRLTSTALYAWLGYVRAVKGYQGMTLTRLQHMLQAWFECAHVCQFHRRRARAAYLTSVDWFDEHNGAESESKQMEDSSAAQSTSRRHPHSSPESESRYPQSSSESESRHTETLRRKGLASVHDACTLLDRDQAAHVDQARALYSVAWLCFWECDALDLEPKLQEVGMCACVCVCLIMHRTCIQTHIQTCRHTHIHMMQASSSIYTFKHTYIQTHTHTHIHDDTSIIQHIYIQTHTHT